MPALQTRDLMQKRYSVYLLASKRRGTLYVGVTNDLVRRACEHREGAVPGFTRTYNIKRLVWFEEYADVQDAIAHEKRLKRWRREWKIALIEKGNPDWKNLSIG